MFLADLLNETYGALLVGILVAAVLFGVTNLQIFLYFKAYQEDWIVYKVAAAGLWTLDALHLCLAGHSVYFYFVTNFGSLAEAFNIVWSFKLQIVMNIITILAVQSLYVFRLWKFNGFHDRRFLLSMVTVLVAVGYGVGIATIYFLYAKVHTLLQVKAMSWLVYMSFGTSTVVDAAIAGVFCWILWTHKTGCRKSNSIVHSIMLYLVGSGAMTSMCSLTCLGTYAALPYTDIPWGINFLLNKLYVNSFLAVLNARQSLKDRRLDSGPICVAPRPSAHDAIELDHFCKGTMDSALKQEESKGPFPSSRHRSVEIMVQREAFAHVG